MLEIIAKIFNEYHWGAFIVSKVQMLVTLLIFVKVYDLPKWITIALIPVFLLALWMVGKIFIKSGMREIFIRYEQTAVIDEIKKGTK